MQGKSENTVFLNGGEQPVDRSRSRDNERAECFSRNNRNTVGERLAGRELGFLLVRRCKFSSCSTNLYPSLRAKRKGKTDSGPANFLYFIVLR